MINLISKEKKEIIIKEYNISNIQKEEVISFIDLINDYYKYIIFFFDNIEILDFYFLNGKLINQNENNIAYIKNKVSTKEARSHFIFDFNDVFTLYIENDKVILKFSKYLDQKIRATLPEVSPNKDAKLLCSYISKYIKKEIKSEIINKEKIKKINIIGNYLIELKKIKKIMVTKKTKEEIKFIEQLLINYKFNFSQNNEEEKLNEIKDQLKLGKDIDFDFKLNRIKKIKESFI